MSIQSGVRFVAFVQKLCPWKFKMLYAEKISIVLMMVVAVVAALVPEIAEAETTKRDLISHRQGLIHLGDFGPVSRLSTHPTFAHLGLTPEQTVGFMNLLLQRGFLHPNALRLANGQPFWEGGIYEPPVFSGSFYRIPVPPFDPYMFFLFSNYARFLPYGLGPQGIYGNTGLPKPQPLRVFKYNEKN